MFDPDLERFKKKYDERFDFNAVTRELLVKAPPSDTLGDEALEQSREKTRRYRVLKARQK